MRIGSLFAGIGGFDLAARWMGWDTAWFSEVDPFCRQVMRHHFPDAADVGDITTLDGTALPAVDMLCGGFPCQDLSVANAKGQGLDGARSGLWREYARLVRECRPRWVVIENVPPLLHRGFAVVRGDLRAAGYRVARPVRMSAAFVGAPHKRERLWIVAYRECCGLRDGGFGAVAGTAGEVRGEVREQRIRPDLEPGEQVAPVVADADDAGPQGYGDAGERAGECAAGAGGSALEFPPRLGRGEGRPESAGVKGGPAVAGASVDVGDTQECAERAGLRADGAAGERLGRYGDASGAIPDWSDAIAIRGADGTTRLVGAGLRVLAHGVPQRVAQLRGFGNAIVPQCALAIFRAIADAEAGMTAPSSPAGRRKVGG